MAQDLLHSPSISPRNNISKNHRDGGRSRIQGTGGQVPSIQLVPYCGCLPWSSVGSAGPSPARHWEEEILHPHLKIRECWFGRTPPNSYRENPENILPHYSPCSDIIDILLPPCKKKNQKTKNTFPLDKRVTSDFPAHGPHWVLGVFITG